MININRDRGPGLDLVPVDRIVDRGTPGRDHDRIPAERVVLVAQPTDEKGGSATESIRNLIGASECSV